jgi:hypothetical protein
MPEHTPDVSAQEIEALIVRDGTSVVSRVGVLVSIYFLEGWSRQKRLRLLSILDDYLGRCKAEVTHYQKPDTRRLMPWDGQTMPATYGALAERPETEGFSFQMLRRAPGQDDDPGLWRIWACGFARTDVTRRLSGLKVHFPPSCVLENPDAFVSTIAEWCARLGCIHGTAGFGVLTVPGTELTGEAWHYRVLKTFPALEYDAMGSYWSETRHGGYEKPRSSNWLTMLGASNVAALGGLDALDRQLRLGVCVKPFDQGVVIRASRLPALRSENNEAVPEAYRVVARMIRPIRFEEYEYGVLKVPEPISGREETLKWIRRFD